MKPLKLVSANDTFAALVALGDVVAGKQAVFFRAGDSNRAADGGAQALESRLDLPDSVPEEAALIVESSGSTGVPKRVQVNLAPLRYSATTTNEILGGPGQWLLALPLTFIAGIQVLVRSILADTQPVMMNPSVPFTAEGFARSASLLTAERRYTSLVPTQLDRLARAVDQDDFLLQQVLRFDAILVGGAAPNLSAVTKLRNLGARIIETYGMTETCGGCVYDGEPLPGVSVNISEAGLITLAGPMLANQELGAGFETSDLGRISTNGKLEVIGRADRVINSGGLKLSLEAVEAFAKALPGVRDAAAVASDHAEFGQSFVCYLEVASAAISVDVDTAVAALGKAASHARWIQVDALPRLANGKPDLQSLQSRAVTELS